MYCIELEVGHTYRIKKEDNYTKSLIDEHNFLLYGTYANPNVFSYGGHTVQRMPQADDYDYEFLYENVTLLERDDGYYLSVGYYCRDSVFHSTVLEDGEIYEIEGRKYELNDMEFEEVDDDDNSNGNEEEEYEHKKTDDEFNQRKFNDDKYKDDDKFSDNDKFQCKDESCKIEYMRDNFRNVFAQDKLINGDKNDKKVDSKYKIIDIDLSDFDHF